MTATQPSQPALAGAARTAAVRRLIAAHPDEYRVIYEEEAESRGIRPKGKREPAACGTNAGFQRHRRDGEDPCAACRRANNNQQKETKAAQREARDTIAADFASRGT